MERLYQLLLADGIDIKKEHPLAPHSSFRVGGKASLATFPKSLEELVTVLRYAKDAGVRCSVFGNASNIVFSDGGFCGLVVFTSGCREVRFEGRTVIASCGAPMGIHFIISLRIFTSARATVLPLL